MDKDKGKIPNLTFLGIGATKSGTTWLADCLSEHPQVFIPFQKEVCFFDWEGHKSNYDKGFHWYASYFKKAGKDQILGEFTTQYMYFENSHNLIKNNYPDIKLIACLRNPVDLAYSLYWWKRSNYEGGSLDVFEKELLKDSQYIERGLFHKQLVKYFDNFPRENIKIVLYEDIKGSPKEVIGEVYDFIGVESSFTPKILNKKVNKTKKINNVVFANTVNAAVSVMNKVGLSNVVRQLSSSKQLSNIYTTLNKKEFVYPPMGKKTRKNLMNIFDDDISKLEILIDRDLSDWKTT